MSQTKKVATQPIKSSAIIDFHKVVKRRYTNYLHTSEGRLVHKKRVYHAQYEPYQKTPDHCEKGPTCKCDCLVDDFERNIDPFEAMMYESESYSSPDEGVRKDIDSDGETVESTTTDDRRKNDFEEKKKSLADHHEQLVHRFTNRRGGSKFGECGNKTKNKGMSVGKDASV